jgi:hypothetical protein
MGRWIRYTFPYSFCKVQLKSLSTYRDTMTLKGEEKKVDVLGPQDSGNNMMVSSLGFLFHISQTPS